MKRTSLPTMAALVALTLIIGACGAGDAGTDGTNPDPDTTSQPDPTDGPSNEEPTVLVEIGDEGGFVMVEFNLRRQPRYVLMTDGTLYTQGPIIEIYPGPALPNILQMQVDDQVVADIRQYVEDMGLADVNEERLDDNAQQIADASDTYVTYYDDEGDAHKLSVYALGMFGQESDVRAAQLQGMIQTLDEAAASQPGEPWTADRVEVWALERGQVDEQFGNVKPWPLEVAYKDIERPDGQFGCVLLEGEAAAEVLTVFAESNELTVFDDGTAERGLIAHPLFPHQESNC